MSSILNNIEIINYTKGKPLSGLSFASFKKDILGEDYALTIIICGEKRAQSINKKTRNKDYVPNTLSLPYSNKNGELILCPSVAKKESKNYETTLKDYVSYLLIHSMLHLKGLDHGKKMDLEEKRLVKKHKIRINL
ncbi:MAG: rRNA maturation RNase YbeY [Candidatus Paceibacterota bacterium]